MAEERWTIRPDGPDGRVDHFYADGNEEPVEVVPLAALQAERAKIRKEIEAWRAEASAGKLITPAGVLLNRLADRIDSLLSTSKEEDG